MTRSILTALFGLLFAGSAHAQKGPTKQEKEARIKILEQEIHVLHEQEKAAVKHLDERYDHVIRNLDPKAVRKQLSESLEIMRHVHKVISEGEFDYGGHRHAAQESVRAAEHQVKKALEHDTHEERQKAGRDLVAAHRDVEKALAFSLTKYGLGSGKKDVGEPETRAAANRQLAESLPKIEFTHHLIAAVDHEIADFKLEKQVLLKRRDEEKKKMHEQLVVQVKPLEEQIKQLKK